jgi:hypothetical protein
MIERESEQTNHLHGSLENRLLEHAILVLPFKDEANKQQEASPFSSSWMSSRQSACVAKIFKLIIIVGALAT